MELKWEYRTWSVLEDWGVEEEREYAAEMLYMREE